MTNILAVPARILRIFWPTLKPDISNLKKDFEKKHPEHCCKLSQDFKSFFRSPFGWCWIDFYSLAWKLHQIFSISQLWRAYHGRCDKVWAWFRKLLLRSTKWYTNHVNCMHQSEDIACQSWRIIAKFGTFKQLYWLNQVTRIFATPARILRIFFSTKPNPTAWVWWEKLTFYQ